MLARFLSDNQLYQLHIEALRTQLNNFTIIESKSHNRPGEGGLPCFPGIYIYIYIKVPRYAWAGLSHSLHPWEDLAAGLPEGEL
jgi:hypothetical protein